MKLAVSIVAYNRPKLLKRALDSLFIQENKNWGIVIVDDNSPNPEVKELATEFVQEFHGTYINSSVEESERLNLCRGAVCVNLAMPYLNERGEIFLHLSDDMELNSPDAVSIILNHFETHPESRAGYFGIGYRLADFRTGHIFTHEEVNAYVPGEIETDGFKQLDIVTRKYPEDYGFGGKLNKVFACLDGGQITYHKNTAIYFPTRKEYWLGEDAFAYQAISQNVGGLDPIGDVNFPLVISNLNEASLSITRDPAKTVAVHNGL